MTSPSVQCSFTTSTGQCRNRTSDQSGLCSKHVSSAGGTAKLPAPARAIASRPPLEYLSGSRELPDRDIRAVRPLPPKDPEFEFSPSVTLLDDYSSALRASVHGAHAAIGPLVALVALGAGSVFLDEVRQRFKWPYFKKPSTRWLNAVLPSPIRRVESGPFKGWPVLKTRKRYWAEAVANAAEARADRTNLLSASDDARTWLVVQQQHKRLREMAETAASVGRKRMAKRLREEADKELQSLFYLPDPAEAAREYAAAFAAIDTPERRAAVSPVYELPGEDSGWVHRPARALRDSDWHRGLHEDLQRPMVLTKEWPFIAHEFTAEDYDTARVLASAYQRVSEELLEPKLIMDLETGEVHEYGDDGTHTVTNNADSPPATS